MRKITTLLIVLMISSSSLAKAKDKKSASQSKRKPNQVANCTPTKWPFSKDLSKVDEKNLAEVPREHLYRYLFYELSQQPKNRTANLAPKLLWYLKSSEPNADRLNFLQALDAAQKTNDGKVNVISVNEICSVWQKIELE